jgi:hypothetical protein
MKSKMLWITAALAVLFSVVALAADVTGKWTGQVPGRNGATESTFTFKVAGDQLTGTMTGPQGRDLELKDGKVAGDDISFKTTLEFNGNSIVLLFKGTVSGNEIKMKRQREGADQQQDFTLKRAS